MTVRALQLNLARAHCFPGPIDGSVGPHTMRALLQYVAPQTRADRLEALAAPLVRDFPKFEILSRLRQCHFLAQAGEETAGFRRFGEIGSTQYFTEHYENRKDLGNTQPGDGAKYRGRGIFMLTGRANYREYGHSLGLDLEDYPTLAANPEQAVSIACLFWQKHGLNALADQDDIGRITRRINGGENGLASREEYLRKLKEVWPE